MPDTLFILKILRNKKRFFKVNKKIIIKPIHGHGGNDIHLLSKFNLKFIKKFNKKT